VPPTEQNKDDLRGGFVGDADNDGNPEVYVLSRDLTTVFATEWVGDPGADVKDRLNYQTTALYNSKDVTPDQNVQFSSVMIKDLDGDGPNHLDMVVTTPNGEHVGIEAGIFLLEFNSSDVAVSVSLLIPDVIPTAYSLHQNYPNPFNPSTNITYDIRTSANVEIVIYNMLGQKVRTLVNEQHPVGRYTISWDGTTGKGLRVGSGIYLYVLKAGTFTESKKMLLLK
jgi:hypothetical protein